MTPYNTSVIRVLRAGPPLTALFAFISGTPAAGQTTDTTRARPDTVRTEPAPTS